MQSRPYESYTMFQDDGTQDFQDIQEFQEFSAYTNSFGVSLTSEKRIFDHEFAIDLLWVEAMQLLHVICPHTHLENGTSIASRTFKDIWFAFLEW